MASFNCSRDDNAWHVHKFGGTSVADTSCMKRCADIMRPLCTETRTAVVVSAMGGKPKVTDMLLSSVAAAAGDDITHAHALVLIIQEKHKKCVSELIPGDKGSCIMELIDHDLQDIKHLLRAARLMGHAHSEVFEIVSGYGEKWSAMIMTEYFLREGLPFMYVAVKCTIQ
jgi:bifunctional aspartokinase / homoserine dehydrogenase 1